MPHPKLLRRQADAFEEVLGEGALVAEGLGVGDVDDFAGWMDLGDTAGSQQLLADLGDEFPNGKAFYSSHEIPLSLLLRHSLPFRLHGGLGPQYGAHAASG